MFYHYNDYLIPVIIGKNQAGFSKAMKIKRKKKVRAHIFAGRFSFLQRISFFCHEIKPDNDFWIFQSLISYADALDEYYTPAFIICDEADRIFFDKYSSELEKYYVGITYHDYMNEETSGEEDKK